ncbi:MAG: membrane dipeptidase [Spirochaetes bacterium]|nr:MAG: membrane dipeptidase [Spirochaetota bacterium]
MGFVPIFDLHADVFMDLVRRGSGPELEARHLRRMRAGGIAGAGLIDCRMAGESSEPGDFERFIRTVRLELEAAGDRVLVAKTAADLDKVFLAAQGLDDSGDSGDSGGARRPAPFAVVVGYEGLNPALGDLSWIERLHREAHVRIAAITHNNDNPFGAGALGASGPEGPRGLTELGCAAVAKMNELGILIDMAHASPQTRKDVLAASTRPVMLSHTSAKAVYDNGRNLDDREMRAIADRGGLLGCMTSPAALAPLEDRNNHSLGRYMAHLAHMIDAAGVEHVGLGMHFCEYLYTEEQYPPVRGLEDASKAQAILDALRGLGYSEGDIEKIAFRNFLRVFAG